MICWDHDHDIADDVACSSNPKPDSIEECKTQSCGEWRTGAWTEVRPRSSYFQILAILKH